VLQKKQNRGVLNTQDPFWAVTPRFVPFHPLYIWNETKRCKPIPAEGFAWSFGSKAYASAPECPEGKAYASAGSFMWWITP
jgi:hypothetical protein